MTTPPPSPPPPPTLATLGLDLLKISPLQRLLTLSLPFALVALYFLLAQLRLWPLAVLTLMYLSFATYGSISHDLVHRTLSLPRHLNDLFLTLIELFAFRSGHAYRLTHLNHHARFPHDDDPEGAAAKMPLWRTLLEGIIFQPRLALWSLRHPHRARPLVILELSLAASLFTLCILATRYTPIFLVYAILMPMGAWIIPLVTSYIPHNPLGPTPLHQTRLFRGKIFSLIALEHLYHLEHHLYPAVPHHNWPKLAQRLDPYFASAGIHPLILGF